MDAKIAFGKRLAAWRAAKKKPNGRKFTQTELAKAADMHPVSVANIERGNRGKSPSLDTVVKLAAALGISVEELTTSLPVEAKEDKANGGKAKKNRGSSEATAEPSPAVEPKKRAPGKRKGKT